MLAIPKGPGLESQQHRGHFQLLVFSGQLCGYGHQKGLSLQRPLGALGGQLKESTSVLRLEAELPAGGDITWWGLPNLGGNGSHKARLLLRRIWRSLGLSPSISSQGYQLVLQPRLATEGHL